MATKKEFETIVKEIMEKPLIVFSDYSFKLKKISKEGSSIFYIFTHKDGDTTYKYHIGFLNKLDINVSQDISVFNSEITKEFESNKYSSQNYTLNDGFCLAHMSLEDFFSEENKQGFLISSPSQYLKVKFSKEEYLDFSDLLIQKYFKDGVLNFVNNTNSIPKIEKLVNQEECFIPNGSINQLIQFMFYPEQIETGILVTNFVKGPTLKYYLEKYKKVLEYEIKKDPKDENMKNLLHQVEFSLNPSKSVITSKTGVEQNIETPNNFKFIISEDVNEPITDEYLIELAAKSKNLPFKYEMADSYHINNPIISAIITEDRKFLLMILQQNQFELWDLENKEIKKIKLENDFFKCCILSSSYFCLYEDDIAYLYNFECKLKTTFLNPFTNKKTFPRAISFSPQFIPQLNQIVIGYYSSYMLYFDLSGKLIKHFKFDKKFRWFKGLSSSKDLITLYNYDSGLFKFFDLEFNQLKELNGNKADDFGFFSNQMKFFVDGGYSKKLNLWNYELETKIILQAHDKKKKDNKINYDTNYSGYQKAVFSPNDTYIACISDNNNIVLWSTVDTSRVDMIGPLDRNKVLYGTNDICFSEDSEHLITAHDDSTAILWNKKGEELARIIGHKNSVLYAFFMNGLNKILTISSDQTIKFWNSTK